MIGKQVCALFLDVFALFLNTRCSPYLSGMDWVKAKIG